MKARIFCFLALVVLLLAGCQPAAPAVVAPPAAPTTEPKAEAVVPSAVPEVVLEVVGANGSGQKFTMDDLKKLNPSEGQAGIKSSTGKITPPALFKGIAIQDLLANVDGWGEKMGVNVVAKDGYMITYSYDQVEKGDFIAYDPATGEEKGEKEPLVLILAYEREGQSMSQESDGTLRMAIITPKSDQVTDGHWSVKWVTKLEVVSLAEEWSLHLVGKLTEDMDRGSFESCSAPACHGATWVDDKNQKWSGVPLFYILGAVDDEITHNGPAFNRDLAKAGYTIDLEAGDGYTVTLDVSKVADNKNIIVANKLDGNALVEKNFPLKLVGQDLSKKEMAGGLAKVILHLDGIASAEPTQAPEPTKAPEPTAAAPSSSTGAALTISGLVEKEVALSLADLKAMDIVKETVEHPKKGNQDVEGVNLKTLLEMAKLKTGAATLVFVAADGFTSEAPLKDVLACDKCLVAFDGESLKAAMPGFQSSVWAKDLVKIEIK